MRQIVKLAMKISDFNLLYEKLVYYNCLLNKSGILGMVLSLIFNFLIRAIFNCDISPFAHIGKDVKIPHAVGIVIGGTAVIGDNTIVMPNVVIGSAKYPPEKRKRHATVGRNCLVGANSIIIGDIIIGESAIIAAGSIVVKDVKPFSKYIKKQRENYIV